MGCFCPSSALRSSCPLSCPLCYGRPNIINRNLLSHSPPLAHPCLCFPGWPGIPPALSPALPPPCPTPRSLSSMGPTCIIIICKTDSTTRGGVAHTDPFRPYTPGSDSINIRMFQYPTTAPYSRCSREYSREYSSNSKYTVHATGTERVTGSGLDCYCGSLYWLLIGWP